MTDNRIPVSEISDFDLYKRQLMSKYIEVRPLYEAYSNILKSILDKCLVERKIKYHSTEARAKLVESFGDKAIRQSDEDPDMLQYNDPINQITDLAGIRIITFFPSTIEEVDKLICEEFDVQEISNKSDLLDQEEKLGYQSIHYLVRLKDSRCNLPEYRRFKGLIAEIQARTILQHAWAEIEHDIEYKSVITIPSSIKRRFMALAGLLEIADREFQSIQDEDTKLRDDARKSVLEGRLEKIDITPDALKAYLDKKFYADGRMNDYSYSFEAQMLKKMGFTNLQQIDDCISGYNDDAISKTIWGKRQGQLSRFDDTLLAGMGENYIKRHPWGLSGLGENPFTILLEDKLDKLEKAGIQIGNHDVKTDD